MNMITLKLWICVSDHAKQTAHVYLSDEEKIMCENDDYKWTGGLIALQKDSTDLQVKSTGTTR